MTIADATALCAGFLPDGVSEDRIRAAVDGGATAILLRQGGAAAAAFRLAVEQALPVCRACRVALIAGGETAVVREHWDSGRSPDCDRLTVLTAPADDGAAGWVAASVKDALQAESDGAAFLQLPSMPVERLRAIAGAVKIPVIADCRGADDLPRVAGSGVTGIALPAGQLAADPALGSRAAAAIAEPFAGGRGMIFDLDGTLLDSMPMWYSIGSGWMRRCGMEPDPALDQDLIRVSNLHDAAVFLKARFDLEADVAAIEAGLMAFADDSYRMQVTAKPGAADRLRKLKADGWKLVLATATETPLATAALQRLGMLDCFEGIVSGGKETPDVYFRALEKLGTRLAETPVCEDAPYAMATARAAGFPVTAVFDPFWGEAWEQAAAAADRVVRAW